MNERPISYYAHVVRPSLPAHVFSPVRSRLLWLAFHIATAAAGIWAISQHIGGGWAAPLWSLVIGQAFAGAAFVGHETMHGAVLRGKRARHLVGWICFLPFALSPTLWNAWHNKVHHGNTGIDGIDPDAFPTRKQYDSSRTTRIADYVSVGRHRWAGFVTLLGGFTGQILQILLVWSKKTDALSARDRRVVWMETIINVGFWATVAWLVGGRTFFFGYGLPLLVGNSIVISYILTNHNLNPLNDVNDPLLNSLTVEVPWIVNLVHLNFGLHVEHHLFPSMSSAYAPHVRDALKAKFPDRYQSMPFTRAMWLLWKTPRVYETPTLLVDPVDGYTAETLAPRSSRTEPAAADEAALPSAA